MDNPALVNGKIDQHVLISDRGLAYGDGLFETIAVIDGALKNWQAHTRRLLAGCQRLNISKPDLNVLAAEAQQLISQRRNAVLKIIITRGSGGRGYAPPRNAGACTRILQVFDYPEYCIRWQEHGITVGICETRLAINPQLAGIKHLNRLEQVLAAQECAANDWDEGLVFNHRDELVSGTKSNVFAFVGGTLKTPLIDECGVLGVMRERVISSAQVLKIEILQARIHRRELTQNAGLFITNAIIGIAPVSTLTLDGSQHSLKLAARERSIISTLQNAIIH